jgi:hypothetical protein
VVEAQIWLLELGTGAHAVNVCVPRPALAGTVTFTAWPLHATPNPAEDWEGLQYTIVADPTDVVSKVMDALDPWT